MGETEVKEEGDVGIEDVLFDEEIYKAERYINTKTAKWNIPYLVISSKIKNISCRGTGWYNDLKINS